MRTDGESVAPEIIHARCEKEAASGNHQQESSLSTAIKAEVDFRVGVNAVQRFPKILVHQTRVPTWIQT
jgi:hypothetical protein